MLHLWVRSYNPDRRIQRDRFELCITHIEDGSSQDHGGPLVFGAMSERYHAGGLVSWTSFAADFIVLKSLSSNAPSIL